MNGCRLTRQQETGRYIANFMGIFAQKNSHKTIANVFHDDCMSMFNVTLIWSGDCF